MRYSRRRVLTSALGAAGGTFLASALPFWSGSGDLRASVAPLIPVFRGSSEFARRVAGLSKDTVLMQLHVGIVGTKPSVSTLRQLRSAPSWEAAARELTALPGFARAAATEVLPDAASLGIAPNLTLLAQAAQVRRLYLGFLGRAPDQWELGMSLAELASLQSADRSGENAPRATGVTSMRRLDPAGLTQTAGAQVWKTEAVRWIR